VALSVYDTRNCGKVIAGYHVGFKYSQIFTTSLQVDFTVRLFQLVKFGSNFSQFSKEAEVTSNKSNPETNHHGMLYQ
jgi:hypothetical protein